VAEIARPTVTPRAAATIADAEAEVDEALVVPDEDRSLPEFSHRYSTRPKARIITTPLGTAEELQNA